MAMKLEEFLRSKGTLPDTKKYVPIKGFENNYGIATNGDIYSFISNIVIKPSVDTKGYLYVILSDDEGEKHIKRNHILVAETYLPNPNKLRVVDHKDGNKQHPDVSNLEWVSHSENTKRAYALGLASHKGNKVAKYTLENEYIKTFNSMTDALRELGKPIKSIQIKNVIDTDKSIYGYKWRSVEDDI